MASDQTVQNGMASGTPSPARRPSRSALFQLGIVCATSFVVWAGFGAILPYLPIFLQEEAHASVGLIGVIAAGYYVGTFAFSGPMGVLSDRVGRKPLLVLGTALYGISTALFLSTTHPGWFLLFRFLEGAAAGTVTPTALAFIADLTTDETRGRAYGWQTSAQFGGLVAGPALAIVLYSLAGGEGRRAFYSIFIFGTVLSLLTAIALLLFVREPATHQRRRPARPPYRTLVTRPVGAFLIVAFTGNVAMGGWEVLWSLWIRHLGGSMAFVGITWMAFSVPMLFSFAAGYLADRFNRFHLMYWGLGFAALAWIFYGVTRSLDFFLLVNLLEGVAVAVAIPAKQSFLVQVSPPTWVGTIQGLEGSSTQLAALVGTLSAPLLYSAISGSTLAVGGLLALAGLLATAPVLSREWVRLQRDGAAKARTVFETVDEQPG